VSYASLMVHVDADEPSEPRIRLAAGIAEQFTATLIGFSACAPRPPVAADASVYAEGVAAEREAIASQLKQREHDFRKAADGGNHPVEWRSAIDLPSEALAREARAADLVVIGRERSVADSYRSVDPGSVILKTGRPVLAVPRLLNTLRTKRILIAWQDTREARRAVHDALPFLHRADEVLVTEIRNDGQDRSDSHVGDIANYLSRHRIAASPGVMLKSSSAPVAEELLRLAEREQTDLIVAGAYGHSRLGEWIFGGVTRDLLATSPVCCLFSH
jgi:nucleotide-binding universal stress UspA family protein